MSLRRSRLMSTLGLGAAAAVLAGCSSGASTSDERPTSSPAGDAHTATVTITSNKCVADRASYEAGGITFKVSNKDATGITEFELLDGERILGEKENLPPGFAGSFSLNLNPGRYEMYCPGATTPRVPFTVTGTATSVAVTDTKALLNQGTASYGAYIEAQIAFLVTNVQPLVAAVNSGDLAAAKAAYAKARPYYERIEPVAESFQISTPPLTPAPTTGSPRRSSPGSIGSSTACGARAASRGSLRLPTSWRPTSASCRGSATGLHYQPAELANGAVGLLDEVSKSKVTGEEERYSHIDLLDFQANVEGSEQAFANLQPGLAKIDSTLTDTISTRFAALDSLLDKYRDKTQPSGFVLYPALSRADVTSLAQSVQAVAEPLSRVASKVVNV